MMNPFHSWLIRQRKYCEHEGCRMKLTKATRVVNRMGKDYVYCEEHYSRRISLQESMGLIEQGLRERGRLET